MTESMLRIEDQRNDLNTRTCQTRYGNNVGINIVKADLSCKRTVRAFLEYTFAIRKKQIEDWKASPTYSASAPQPVAYTGAYPVMGGQPANQAQIQIAADRWRRIPRWNGHIHAIFGPFHALLKTFNAIGDLFANIIPWLA